MSADLPATSRQTFSGPIRGGIAHVPRSPLKSVHGAVSKDGAFCARLSKSRITRRTPYTTQAIIWQFRWYGARSVDDTDHQTWNISHSGERGWRDLFVLGDPELDGAVFLVTVFSPVGVLVAIKSCLETLHNPRNKHRLHIECFSFKSNIFHVHTKSKCFQWKTNCPPMEIRTWYFC